MEEKKIKKGLEILPSLHQKLKSEAARNGIPLWLAFQQAVELWLAEHGEGSQRKSESDHLSTKERRLNKILTSMLRSKDRNRHVVTVLLEDYEKEQSL